MAVRKILTSRACQSIRFPRNTPLSSEPDSKMKKICFTVPVEHCEQVKAAMYDAGAGRFEGYDLQCWQVLGQAEFRPLAGSNPTIGEPGKLENVPEYKVEMFCKEEYAEASIAALRASHPYEGPQFEIYTIENSLSIVRE